MRSSPHSPRARFPGVSGAGPHALPGPPPLRLRLLGLDAQPAAHQFAPWEERTLTDEVRVVAVSPPDGERHPLFKLKVRGMSPPSKDAVPV
jgi:hypothetical protein